MENKINLIGVNGKIGSGKDTVGKIIQYLVGHKDNLTPFKLSKIAEAITKNRKYGDYNWQIKKFAGKIKETASLLTGIPIEKWEDQEFKKQEMGEEWKRTLYKIVDAGGNILNTYLCKEDALYDLDFYGEFYEPPLTEKEEVLTYSLFLQLLGTDAMRMGLHPDVWVNALFANYTNEFHNEKHCTGGIERHRNNCLPQWLITDLRFPNEYDAVKQRGGICVRVNREDSEMIKCLNNPEYFYEKYITINGEKPLLRDIDREYIRKYLPSKDTHPSETALANHEFDYIIENNAGIPELIEEVKKMLVHFKLI